MQDHGKVPKNIFIFLLVFSYNIVIDHVTVRVISSILVRLSAVTATVNSEHRLSLLRITVAEAVTVPLTQCQ